MSKSQHRRISERPAYAGLGSQLGEAVASQVAAVQTLVEGTVDDLRLAARSSVPVLITARSALERESLARLIHRGSRRGEGPFMMIDCDLQRVDSLESLVEAADGGTVFLDEVGAMKKPMQNALSALLERDASSAPDAAGRFNPRIITGSSRSLRSQVTAGTFSQDLFYRLNVIHIVPGSQPPGEGRRLAPVRSHRPCDPNVFPRALDE